MKLRPVILLSVCVLANAAYGYTIRGTFGQLSACYHPVVYLEVVKEIDGFYSADSHNLIASAPVASDGSFLLTGSDLPKEVMFYRLYVTPSAKTKTYIMNGPNPNYILLALGNATEEEVSCPDFCVASSTYTVATEDNRVLASIAQRRARHIAESSADLSESKLEFLEASYKADMRSKADTSRSIAALYAAFLADVSGPELLRLAASLEKRFPHSEYVGQLTEEAESDNMPAKAERSARVIFILSALLAASFAMNLFLLFRKKKGTDKSAVAEQQAKELIETLSIKEREILKMVHQGLSNKEIADKHNIEVSTVKTHVSRIYQKTGIRNRKEVASIARFA